MQIQSKVIFYKLYSDRSKYIGVIFTWLLAIVGAISLSGCASAERTQSVQVKNSQVSSAPLIPRSELFGNPTYSSLKLSPDGKQVAYKKMSNGALNIWVGPTDNPEAAVPVTSFKKPVGRSFRWSADGQYLLMLEDWAAKEIWQLWSVDLESGIAKNLIKDPTTRTEIIGTSKKYPTKVLVSLNTRDARFEDVYLMDIKTGEREEVFRNDGQFISFRADANLKVNLAERGNEDGSSTYFSLDGDTRTELFTVPLEALRSTRVMSYNKGVVTLLDSRNAEYASLVKLNTATGERTVLAQAIEADINGVFFDKKSKSLWATREDPLVPKWTIRSPAAEEEFTALINTFGHTFSIAAQPDDKRLLILDSPKGLPGRYHWWDRETKTAKLIFSTRPNLDKYKLAEKKGVMIPTRDGLTMPSYLTLPPGTPVNAKGFPTKAIPLVVIIHGGPWGRSSLMSDRFFNGVDYWLADRGYAALSINFRGSVGFGNSFTSAADKEWAGDMHNDVIDSVDWAIKNGITVRDKVASYGRSYGGYASLVSLAFTPDRFQCAIATAAPSNLKRITADMPAWWRYQWPQWTNRIGDPNNEKDAIDLLNRSPITRTADIKGNLLITATGGDPRVLIRQSESMVAAMEALHKPVTYLVYEDEGHGGYKAEVTTSMRAVQEHFLSDCFGNAAEPFGSDLERSDIEVKSGVNLIPGLPQALKETGNKRFSVPHIIVSK
ncbi:S9 family peptidase [Colwellia sp. RE-S-Sl-9]